MFDKFSKEWCTSYMMHNNLLSFIINYLPERSTILELGSGHGTKILAKHFNMISIEHDINFINMYDSNYVYAPIVNSYSWYDVSIVKKNLVNLHYDLIIVDGPGGGSWKGLTKRIGFYENINLFKTNLPIIIDDFDRADGHELVEKLSSLLNKKVKVIDERSAILI